MGYYFRYPGHFRATSYEFKQRNIYSLQCLNRWWWWHKYVKSNSGRLEQEWVEFIPDKQLEKLILSYADIFYKNKRDLGKLKFRVKYHIHLNQEAVPVEQPFRQITFGYQEEVRNYLKTMLNDGIEKSSSEWASLLVLAPKPLADLRICVDNWKLN